LDVIDGALVDAQDGTAPRLILSMPPQEGKSVRVSRIFALWLLIFNPNRRIAIISYADALARRWGRDVRNLIKNHPEFGLTLSADTAASNEWALQDYDGGIITSGIEAGLTGRPADVILIDDPIKGQKEADSVTYREMNREWWRTTGSSRLSEDAIVVLVMTRWHEDDLAGWLQLEYPSTWRVINIPAKADHDPSKGETDLLGRQPGEYMISARNRTPAGWAIREKDAGTRGWQALYQGRPTAAEGGIFKRAWWVFYDRPRAIEKPDGTWEALGADQVIQSWDLAFKDTSNSDYVAGQVWARRGAQLWLLDLVCERMDFPTTIAAIEAMSAKWPQAVAKVIEDKANGPAVIASLRNTIGGLIAYNPIGSKEARAHAVSPRVQAGDVQLPHPLGRPDIVRFINQCANFPNDVHDDEVDAFTQAANHMLLASTLAGDFMDELMKEGPGDTGGAPLAADHPVMNRPDVADAEPMTPFDELYNAYRELDIPDGIAPPTMGTTDDQRGTDGAIEDW
jgi:predicted phage terminase large subunit-like protein